MKPYYREFPQPDGSVKICEHDGEKRLPTRYVGKGEPVPPKKEPRRINPVRKAANFAMAAAKHVAAGRPMATDEQVAERFAICQACPKFIEKGEGVGECSMCGCGIKAVGVEGLSKLRWATEQCPLLKPRWKAIPSPPPAV